MYPTIKIIIFGVGMGNYDTVRSKQQQHRKRVPPESDYEKETLPRVDFVMRLKINCLIF
jgi:hypothetical protein